MAFSLKGKVALVSGGASGIGAAHVRVFAEAGAKVMAGDLQKDLGQKVVEAVNASGGQAAFTPLDVTSEDSWAAAVAATVDRFGGLTTLVNNAGIYQPGGVEDETRPKWEKMIAVNQTGVWLGMKAAMPELLKSGNGAIVNISSLYGIVGSPGNLAYHATKGAVHIMTKSAALEYVKRGVRVNAVFPGQIDTPILGDLTEELRNAIAEGIPIGYMGEPEDIAYTSLFLASDEAKYVTGAGLPVDGGWGAGSA